jgi:hypothetical protein
VQGNRVFPLRLTRPSSNVVVTFTGSRFSTKKRIWLPSRLLISLTIALEEEDGKPPFARVDPPEASARPRKKMTRRVEENWRRSEALIEKKGDKPGAVLEKLAPGICSFTL